LPSSTCLEPLELHASHTVFARFCTSRALKQLFAFDSTSVPLANSRTLLLLPSARQGSYQRRPRNHCLSCMQSAVLEDCLCQEHLRRRRRRPRLLCARSIGVQLLVAIASQLARSRHAVQRMQESMMAQIGMDHEHHSGHEIAFGSNDGWVEINNSYASSQNQSPMYEHGGFGFIQPLNQLPAESSFNSQRMSQPHPVQTTHQQLLPLIMPSHPTWPSMLTNPASYPAPPVAIPPASAPPVVKGNAPKLPAIHATPSPRKTLTDSDRRRMCQYHEDNPSVKQTEIGGES